MQMEGDWITEWGSVGQPYLALLGDWSSGETTWTLIGVTNTDAIDMSYGAGEMLAQHGDPYTAAAMELYRAYLAETAPETYGTAADLSYYIELAAGEAFRDMNASRRVELLAEYGDLLDDYTLIVRETPDGTSGYILGQYNGDPAQSPLSGMYAVEISTG